MSRPIPIIRFKSMLIVSIQVELSDELVVLLRDDLAFEMAQENVHGLVIEVSGVDVFDSYIACSVRDISLVAKMMGVETVLAGLDSALAITLVEMGMDMRGMKTALNLEEAVDMLGELATSNAFDEHISEEQLLVESELSEDDDWALLME